MKVYLCHNRTELSPDLFKEKDEEASKESIGYRSITAKELEEFAKRTYPPKESETIDYKFEEILEKRKEGTKDCFDVDEYWEKHGAEINVNIEKVYERRVQRTKKDFEDRKRISLLLDKVLGPKKLTH